MATKAREISLADFVEESLSAVNRVIEIGPNRDRFGRIIFGLIWDDGRSGGVFGFPDFDPADLEVLRIRKPLNRESVNEMTDLLQRDYRRYGIPFATAIGQDFGRTIDTLFELSREERNTIYEIARKSSDSSEAVSRMLIAAFSIDAADFQFDLDIPPLPDEKQVKSIKWNLDFSVTQDLTKDKPSLTLKIGISW